MPDLNYPASEIQLVLDMGPEHEEDFFRIVVSGSVTSKHLNVSHDQLVAIRDIVAGDDHETYDSDLSVGGSGLTRLSVTARRNGDQFTGWVYLGVTVVFTFTGSTSGYPAGIEDFAGITIRRFSERLAHLIDPTT